MKKLKVSEATALSCVAQYPVRSHVSPGRWRQGSDETARVPVAQFAYVSPTQYSASWPHRELRLRRQWRRSHGGPAPFSADPSLVPWPHMVRHRRS
eukprot:4701487-Pyramimonas_sp.AAC.1